MKNRIKENTWHTKEHIMRTKILPYFGQRKISVIQPKDIIAWQNEMIKATDKQGKGRMTAIVLFPFETSIPTEFICIPPIQLIRNRDPSFSHCRFNLLGDTNSITAVYAGER